MAKKIIKDIILNEVLVFVIGLILTAMVSIMVCLINGITDFDGAYTMGVNIGLVSGIILRFLMIAIIPIVIIADCKKKGV